MKTHEKERPKTPANGASPNNRASGVVPDPRTTSVARVNAAAEAVDYAIPADAPTGFEYGQPEDQLLPRVSLCQSMTPQRKKTNNLFIAGLSEGDFFNNITNAVYGPAIDVVPLLKFSSRIYFAPMDTGGGILCRSFNAISGGQLSPMCQDCEHYDWTNGENNERIKPACTLFMNYPCYILNGANVDLAVLSFKSTLLGLGRQWFTRMSMVTAPNGQRLPMYGSVWRLRSTSKSNNLGEWYTATVEAVGRTPKGLFERALGDARGLSQLIGKTMVVNVRGEAEEVSGERDKSMSAEGSEPEM